MSTHTPAGAFTRWLAGASAGDRYHYYTGYLGRDRDPSRGAGWRETDAVARIVAQAAEEGWVTLTQRRVDQWACAYFATRTEEIMG